MLIWFIPSSLTHTANMKVIAVLSAAVALELLLHSASAFHPYRNRLSPLSSLEDDTGVPASRLVTQGRIATREWLGSAV